MRLRNLGVAAYVRNWTMWHYSTTDMREQIEDPAYWADAVDTMKLGDEVHITHEGEANSIWCVVAAGDAIRLKCMIWCRYAGE